MVGCGLLDFGYGGLDGRWWLFVVVGCGFVEVVSDGL